MTRGHSAAVGRVQHRRRAGGGSAAVRPRAGRPGRTRPGRSRARSPPRSCRSGSRPTGRGACSSGPTARRSRRATSARPAATVRQKPDITAADGVTTSVAGFDAVLRHVGGGAARGRDRGAGAVGQPRRRHRRRARGVQRDRARPRAGRAWTAAPGTGSCAPTGCSRYTGATPQPLVRAGTPTVTPTTGDGDAFLEPGERATRDAAGDEQRRRDGDRRERHGVDRRRRRRRSRPRSRSYGNIARRGDDQDARLHARARARLPARASRCRWHGAGDVRRRAVADDEHARRPRPGSRRTDGDDVRLRRAAGGDPGQRRRRRVGDDPGQRASATRRR